VAYISYVLIVCSHSPHWATLKRCSSALILHAGVLLLRVSRLSSFLPTYIRTFGRNAVLGIGGLHHVRVARLSSFAVLAYSYALLVCPHSPRWRTAPTRFLLDLVFADLHSDVWQKCRVRHPWRTSRTCCSFVLIRRAGLLLRIARLPHSPRWRTAPTRFSCDLIFADLHSDVWKKRRVRHRWPISHSTCCSFVLICRASLLLRIARLPSFSTLAYYSYAFLV